MSLCIHTEFFIKIHSLRYFRDNKDNQIMFHLYDSQGRGLQIPIIF